MSLNDRSFVFPLTTLENSRIRLIPFDLEKHGPAFIEGTKDRPDLFKYMSIGPYNTLDDLKVFIDSRLFSNDAAVAFAIMVKATSSTEPESLGGMVGYLNSSADNCVTEIGFITILPKYHGTFVTKNAAGLLIMYALDPAPSGLGLRRVEWQCHAGNEASKKFARKMLFTYEGTKRFERTLPVGKVGNGYDTSGMTDFSKRELGQSRDTDLYAHYCDEWPEKRSALMEIMNRN